MDQVDSEQNVGDDMKAILSFNLPKDKEDYELCMNGPNYFCTISEFDNELRDKLKHGDLKEEEYKIYDKIRTRLWAIAEENKIDIWR